MNQTEATTIDDLPELPFEQVLSYLSLENVIKARAVSRGWYHRINSFRVKSLCCSKNSRHSIDGRNKLIRGTFDQNFIGSPEFVSFLTTFRQTILANLKRLRLHDFRLYEDIPALNSFVQLEELYIFDMHTSSSPQIELNLPMVRSIHLKCVDGVDQLILDMPKLQQVKVEDCLFLKLIIVHGESVERLLTDWWHYLPVKSLKNLRALYFRGFATEQIDPNFLTSLEQLREADLVDPESIRELFEQKRRYGRADLKIYRFGCLLNGPDDPIMFIGRFSGFESALTQLAENPTRVADELPLCRHLDYSDIEPIANESAVGLLKRMIDLEEILVGQWCQRVKDVQHFLDLLKSLDITVALWINGAESQDLFDRLPEHYAVQFLTIEGCPTPSDLQFLFRLKSLVDLRLEFSLDIEVIRKAWELPQLSLFKFEYHGKKVLMRVEHSKRFEVLINGQSTVFGDLNAAIQFVERT